MVNNYEKKTLDKSIKNFGYCHCGGTIVLCGIHFQTGANMKLHKRNRIIAAFRQSFALRFGRRRRPNKKYLSVCIAISTAVVFYIGCRCLMSLQRTVSAVWDVITSVGYYLCNFYVVITEKDNPVGASVVGTPITSDNVLFPQTYEAFVAKIKGFGETFFSAENFRGFVANIPQVIYNLSIVLMFALPIVLLAVIMFRLSWDEQNNDTDVTTVGMRKWQAFCSRYLYPIAHTVREFWQYAKQRKFVAFWLVAALLGINAFTYLLEAFAFVLYFATSFDFANIYTQLYKLLVDLDITLSALPAAAWVVLAYLFVCWWRQRLGTDKLRHLELCNCGYVNTFGVATMLTGNMGVGKTKLNTDMILTLETKFKTDAKDILFQIERWFPFFPWATVQNELKQAICFHQIYNLTTAEAYARKKRIRFEKSMRKQTVYGYDYRVYGLTYNDELQLWNIFDCLEEYTKAFFVYFVSKSLICGNYSIREDGIMDDIGNMPMWDYDYFSRSPLTEQQYSYYANILDFDALRKGKHVVKGSKFADTFEFGIVAVTELDKERGNTQDNKELKKNCDEANQKNDLFNYSAKMGRHPATIMYKAFVRFMFDQQRAMKTEADMREICDKVINIDDVDKDNLAMPMFWVEEILYCIVKPQFDKLYESYRFNRADNSLLMYFVKNTLGRYVNWYERVYNKYGYDVYTLVSDSGKLDGSALTSDKYYLLHKKALSHRYSTDCYKDFFRAKSAKKRIGIVDYPTFGGVTATADELRQMNSYFINDMVNKICSEEDK